MELKHYILKNKIVLFVAIIHLFSNNFIHGQSWSIEYVLEGDSLVYSLSQDKILQGKPVDFFFPAYKYYQTSSMSAIESKRMENREIIELEFDNKNFNLDRINFEIDLYAEGIDTIQYFFKTINDSLILLRQNVTQKGYKYLPTTYLTENIIKTDFKSIQIVGKAKDENRKFIIGRLNGSKKIRYTAKNISAVDSFVSKYPFEKQSDMFYELPSFHIRLHGFDWKYRLAFIDCNSSYDSIQCISQFTNMLLDIYELYDVYGINKQELINRNVLLAETVNDIDSYYRGMKEIIALLNNCHIRLSTNRNDEIESPLQPVYFYNTNNEIAVSAIFDTVLIDRIQLDDRILSINNIPIKQLYSDFSKNVFASTPQQREIKITQKLLYTAREIWGDSLLVEFQNGTNTYSVHFDKSNFTGRKTIPEGFKTITDNTIEKYNNILYFRPIIQDVRIVPFVYSHVADFNNCKGLILDFRGCPGGDHSSFSALFSLFISENHLLVQLDSSTFSLPSDLIVKPSKQINMRAPIVVLIDARTTCYPEIFTNALRKNRSDIYVIGATNSAGSAQLNLMTILPRNAILIHFEGTIKDAFGKVIDDNIGVIPDTIVKFDSYNDLFPYNDKLKRYALKYLGYTMDESIDDNDESQSISFFNH